MSFLPPRWKLIREINRIRRRLMVAPSRIFAKTLAPIYYDLVLSKSSRTFEGAFGFVPNVAIYLIFPNDGVKASHLVSLRNIIEAGYAPLVISNLALSESDRDLLLGQCWKLIERPNFGYDFGGYRDGILSLKSVLPNLNHLALFNDSCWFPLDGSQNWLNDAESMGLDLVAAAFHGAVDRIKAADYLSSGWGFDPQLHRFHYGSFALLFGRNILGSAAFVHFWKRYPMTNSKDLTVRLGEVELTKWVVSQGFSHGNTCDLSDLPAILAALSDDRLAEVLRNLILPFDIRLRAILRQFEAVSERSGAWRAKAEAIALAGAVRTGAAYALSDLLITELGFQFLKKSPLWLERSASAATLLIASRMPGQIGAVVRAEAQEILLWHSPEFPSVEAENALAAQAMRRPE